MEGHFGQFPHQKTDFISTFKLIQELYIALLVMAPKGYIFRLGSQKHFTQQVVRVSGTRSVQSFRYQIRSDFVGKPTKDYLTSYGHITLDIPDPIRTLKSSRVEPT